MTAGRDPRYERWVRFWLRAFPKRYRAVHTEEILGTLADVEPPGVTRPGAATAVDLVRAGWAERLRSRPPLWRWCWYRLGGKLPPQYRAWLLDDLQGWYRLRYTLFIEALYGAIFLPYATEPDPMVRRSVLGIGLVLAVVGLVTAPIGAGFQRRRILRRHALDESFGQRGPFTLTTLPTGSAATAWMPVKRVAGAARATALFIAVGTALVASFPINVITFFAPNLGPETISIGPDTLVRTTLDHQWGTGVGAIALAAAILLVTAALAPRWWRTMHDRALAPQSTVLPTGAMPLLAAFGIMAWAAAGFFQLVPQIFPTSLLAVSGAGPAVLYLGLRAYALERRTGCQVPTPFTWRRAVPPASFASPSQRDD